MKSVVIHLNYEKEYFIKIYLTEKLLKTGNDKIFLKYVFLILQQNIMVTFKIQCMDL